ncbi:MAG: hypothetical protein ACRDPM_22105 [Solirubrobacteraceae bacterium]
MGLLDDAIRDHLDLKRRRGADPGEVERAEREALGPVRRNPTPAELDAADEAVAAEGAPAYDHAGDEGWSHDSMQEPVGDVGVESVYDEPPPEPVQAPPEFPAPAATPLDDVHDSLAEEPVEEEPTHEPLPPPPAPSPPLGAGPETAEYNVEDALAAEEHREQGDGDEDVLEETPEFLQDTPDHDRLWFEQRPPKDFDFDE